MSDPKKQKAALALQKDTARSVKEICEILGVSATPITSTSEPRTSPHEEALRTSRCPVSPAEDNESADMAFGWKTTVSSFGGREKRAKRSSSYVLQRYGMEKASKDSHEYLLSIPYTTDEELDRIIYDDI